MKKLLLLTIVASLIFACKPSTKTEKKELSLVDTLKLVNPNTSKEARELLAYMYEVQGNNILSGVHNYPQFMSDFTDSMTALTGKVPAVWGGDFGFSDDRHPTDHIKYRQNNLVNEIKKQHEAGAIITLTYHQANPIEGEPCLFKPGVQYTLTDQQWEDLLTPGTEVYESWRIQMDTIANYLQQIEDANIPVLFRPYHEMNGSWFWWGGRPDDFKKLWVQLFNYYTNELHLDNLVWVWSSDRPWEGFDDYYPGHEYVDMLGCDIYPLSDTNIVFRQVWYDRMVDLADGRPFGLTEHSVMPTDAEFDSMPGFVYFLSWCDLVFSGNEPERLKEIYNSDWVLTLDEVKAP